MVSRLLQPSPEGEGFSPIPRMGQQEFSQGETHFFKTKKEIGKGTNRATKYNSNSRRISTNANNIADNRRLINVNAGNIAANRDRIITNADNIGDLHQRMARAKGDIDTNRQGIALALAMTAPQLDPGRNFAVSASVGHFDGESALGVMGPAASPDSPRDLRAPLLTRTRWATKPV